MGNFCLKALNQTIIDNLNEKSGRYKNKISMESDKALLEITMRGFFTIWVAMPNEIKALPGNLRCCH